MGIISLFTRSVKRTLFALLLVAIPFGPSADAANVCDKTVGSQCIGVTAAEVGKTGLYRSDGTEIGTTANPVVVQEGAAEIGRFMVTTFRTVGLASSPHVIFTIENPGGSGRIIGIERCTYQGESTALSTALVSISFGRTTALPSGGTSLNIVRRKTAVAPVAVVRGATASDGGGATTITATIQDRAWTQFRQRLITAAGYITTPDNPIVPVTSERFPFEVIAGAAAMVQVNANALTTDHHLVNCAWVEF